MNRKFTSIKLFTKDTKKAYEIANKLNNELLKHNYVISDKNYDLAISIGGDGTFIKMIHENNFNRNITYTGINAGSLGFLVEFDKISDLINSLNNNSFIKKQLSILKAKIYTNNSIKEYLCLNDFTIKRSDLASLRADVYINNDLLENFVGDGLVINTPLGSTAYNLSLNGSIMDNDLNAYSLSSIAPINNAMFNSLRNSMIITNNKKLIVIFKNKQNISFIADNKVLDIKDVLKIEISMCHNRINTIKKTNYSFINQVYNKIVK